jgi:hypothetical protein
MAKNSIGYGMAKSVLCIKLMDNPLDGGGPDKKFPDTVWRVSWSLSGNILAVSCGDGKVTLWKEVVSTAGVGKAKETWECITDMTS